MISTSGKAILGLSCLAALAAVLWPSQLPTDHRHNSVPEEGDADPQRPSSFASLLGKCPLGYESSSRSVPEAGLPRAVEESGSLGPHIWSRSTQLYQLYYNATIWTADEQASHDCTYQTMPALTVARVGLPAFPAVVVVWLEA